MPQSADWESTFLANMIAARRRMEMSQTNLAKRVAELGVPCHQPTIQRIEAGERAARLAEVQAITSILFAGDIRLALTPPDPASRARALVSEIDLAHDELQRYWAECRRWFERGRVIEDELFRQLMGYTAACVEEGTEGGGHLQAAARDALAKWREVLDRLRPSEESFSDHDRGDERGEHSEAG